MTSRRAILGAWPGGVGSGFGLRVSQPGKDAASLDDRDLTFSSDWPAVLPLLQAGQFALSAGQTGSVAFPDPGYVPFCFFMVNGTSPFGTPTYSPVIPIGQWCAYQNITYKSDASYLRLGAGRGVIDSQYALYAPGSNSLGWPGSFTIAYAVYRLPAA